MKHRRAWITLFTVCALLAQTLAVASALPMNPSAAPAQAQQSQEQARPCQHGADADQTAANCCCNGSCDYAALCGGGFALTSAAVPLTWQPAAGSVVATSAGAVIPAYTLTPLRPPITSQS